MLFVAIRTDGLAVVTLAASLLCRAHLFELASYSVFLFCKKKKRKRKMRRGVFFCCTDSRKTSQDQPVSLKGLSLLSSSRHAVDARFFFFRFDNKQTSVSHLCLCSIYLIISAEPAVQDDGTLEDSLISLAGNREKGGGGETNINWNVLWGSEKFVLKPKHVKNNWIGLCFWIQALLLCEHRSASCSERISHRSFPLVCLVCGRDLLLDLTLVWVLFDFCGFHLWRRHVSPGEILGW